MAILQSPENIINAKLTELQRSLGIDLKLTPDGDLELNNLNDISVIASTDNAAQAIFIKLNVEPGSIVYHPELGTDLQIGGKTRNALDIKTQIIRSLSKDPRFDSIDANVQVIGDIVLVNLRVTLANTGIEIPFQFAVPG